MRTRAIPLVDARALRPWARITAVGSVAFSALAVACVVAFLLASRNPGTRTFVGLPPRSDGVLVLDLSASISSDTFARIGTTLRTLSRSGGRFGLVVFSNNAYEALPPGTPASDLQPLIRYFTLPRQKTAGYMPKFPPNPWSSTFTSGTKISAGMQLATGIAANQRKPATIVLVSDLDDDPSDLPTLAQVLLSDRIKHVPVRIVGLDPTPSDVAFFHAALGRRARIIEAPSVDAPTPRNATPFPWTLVALAAAAAVALAARLAWAPRLTWRTP